MKPITYVAIGASDTVGVGADDPATQSWAALLFNRMPAGSKFVRLGVDGATTVTALRDQAPAAESAGGDLVTVWLATNDFDAKVPLDVYETNLDEILKRASNGGRVFVGNLPDLAGIPKYADLEPGRLGKEMAQWNEVIERTVAENDAVLVDVFAASQQVAALDLPVIASDGFHPSTLGYQLIAELFWTNFTQDPLIGPVISAG